MLLSRVMYKQSVISDMNTIIGLPTNPSDNHDLMCASYQCIVQYVLCKIKSFYIVCHLKQAALVPLGVEH